MKYLKNQYAFMAIVLLAVAGCASNPFKEAQGPNEQIWVVLKEYRNVLDTQVLPAMRDTRIPENVRRTLGDLNRQGTPAVIAAVKSYSEFAQAKAEVAAGLTTEDKLLIAAENLNSHVQDLHDIVVGFKGGLPKETRP